MSRNVKMSTTYEQTRVHLFTQTGSRMLKANYALLCKHSVADACCEKILLMTVKLIYSYSSI